MGKSFGRIFNLARKEQGFHSQAHLDAFYACEDHRANCLECQKPGGSVWLEGDASWQPVVNECDEYKRLYKLSIQFGGAK